MNIDTSVRWAIVNDGSKEESFLRDISARLSPWESGEFHTLTEEEPTFTDPSVTKQLYGFAGEVWRGRMYRRTANSGRHLASLELVPNFDVVREGHVVMVTIGVALLIHRKYMTVSEFWEIK